MPSKNVYADSEQEIRTQWKKNNSAKIIDRVVLVEKRKSGKERGKSYSFPVSSRDKYRVDWHYPPNKRFTF